MKVLHVLNTGKYSGAENVVITLIHALDGEFEFAYTSPDGPIRDILKEEGIRYYPVSAEKINASELKKVIEQYKPDIVHTHDFNAGIMACLADAKIPIINHLHNNVPWLKKICPKSISYFLSCTKYKKILTVSESVMDEFVFGKTLRKKSQIVGNPIDLSKIRNKANEQSANVASSDVVFLGRISPQKRPIFFLEIISEVAAKIPDIRVAMVGSGELYNDVELEIAELNLKKNVTLYGFQKNPYGFVKSSKVMCMPSAWEGFGLAAVEGLALGKPVVAAPVGGLKNIIDDHCGKLCESKEAFSQEIIKLLSSESYYAKKAQGAAARAEEYDNIKEYSRHIAEIYQSVVNAN